MTNNEKYLVVGAGNISKKHIDNIKTLKRNSLVFNLSSSGRNIDPQSNNADYFLRNFQEAHEHKFNAVIIASPASFHIEHALFFSSLNIPLLIEKPLSDDLSKYKEASNILLDLNQKVKIAYNLRYLNSMIFFKNFLDKNLLGKIYSIQSEVGQNLINWRPKKNYKDTVSSNKKLGGGALLELSHELDYLTWIFGDIEGVFCKFSNTNHFDIDVEDNVDSVLQTKSGVCINLHMDFLQNKAVRKCKVIGEMGTLDFDLLENRIILYHENEQLKIVYDENVFDQNQPYIDMLKDFLNSDTKKIDNLASLDEAKNVLAVIEAMRASSKENSLIRVD
jgi:predicted dehydrogenase